MANRSHSFDECQHIATVSSFEEFRRHYEIAAKNGRHWCKRPELTEECFSWHLPDGIAPDEYGRVEFTLPCLGTARGYIKIAWQRSDRYRNMKPHVSEY